LQVELAALKGCAFANDFSGYGIFPGLRMAAGVTSCVRWVD
jgi:hypothetical protein